MLPFPTSSLGQYVWLGLSRLFNSVSAFVWKPAASRSVLFIALGLLWFLSIAGGLTLLARHQMTPGEMTAASVQWPEDSSIARNPTGYTLLLFAHPRCSCTRASLHEFKKIVASNNGHLAAYVVFLKPADCDESWLATDQVATAKSLTGVQVLTDTAGQEAKRFGAATSGHVALYGPEGTLKFHGGITLGRGHVGENVGGQSVERVLANQVTDVHKLLELGCPVFGCPLFGKEKAE